MSGVTDTTLLVAQMQQANQLLGTIQQQLVALVTATNNLTAAQNAVAAAINGVTAAINAHGGV